MGVLYLTQEGSVAKKHNGKIIIEKDGEKISQIPIEQIEGVVVFSGAHLTESVMTSLMKNGSPVTYLSSKGYYYGRLEPVQSVNVERQLAQAELLKDEKFCLNMAKEFTSSKLHNQKVILRWFLSKSSGTKTIDLDFYTRMERKIKSAENIEEVIGYEGVCAKEYFNNLSMLCNPIYKFKSRTRQPPKDPFNSMLSFGYTLLMYEIYTLLNIHGLNPYFGFMHKPRRGHPALASDLMEEWRPILVDSFVLHLANRNSFKPEDFETDHKTGGVYLGRNQARNFVKRFEDRVMKSFNNGDHVINYRKQLMHQVEMIAKVVDTGNTDYYKSYRIR